ncbi:MAG: hypothetical protein HY290_00275 [Planctomycetia bacterium]|nr:hypothetical protein [Planctomycetia bacterium]
MLQPRVNDGAGERHAGEFADGRQNARFDNSHACQFVEIAAAAPEVQQPARRSVSNDLPTKPGTFVLQVGG